MKKLFLILALIPLLGMGGGQSVITGRHRIPAAAASGIAYVKSATCASTSAYHFTYSPSAAGDTLVIGLFRGGAAVSDITSVSDSASDAGSLLKLGMGTTGVVYGILSVSSGVTYISITASSDAALCVVEYSGVKHFGNVGNGTSTSSSYTATLTMQDAGNYNVLFDASNNGTATAVNGTIRTQTNFSSTTYWMQDNTSASTGSLTTSGTISGSGYMNNPIAVELRSQ